MTATEHGFPERSLDAALAELPRDIAPARDLWPQIEARLEPRGVTRRPWAWQLAAACVLVVASSLVTAVVLHQDRPAAVAVEAPASSSPGNLQGTGPGLVPVALPSAYAPGDEYLATRQKLLGALAQRLERLPPGTRQRIEGSLAEIRRASDDIRAELAHQPGDALLEELLLNTYQDELAVIATVNQLTQSNGAVNGADEKRMTL